MTEVILGSLATILTGVIYLAFRVGNLTGCIKQLDKRLDAIEKRLNHIETYTRKIIERLTQE